jgi:hypothetical protein
MTENTAVAKTEKKPGLIQVFGEKYNVEPALVRETLLNGAFKGVKQDHELISLLVIANSYDLNPFLKEMGGFAKDGVVYPMIFKDGWIRVLLRQPSYKGKVYTESLEMLKMEGSKPCAEWIECSISFNDGRDPETARVYLREWFRNTPTWKSMPYQMLKGKAMKEAVRESFGINLYDEDDKERILAEGGNDMIIEPASSSAEKAKQALRPTKSSLHAQEAPESAPVAVDEVTGEVFEGELIAEENMFDGGVTVEGNVGPDEPAAEEKKITRQTLAAIGAAFRNNGWSKKAYELLLAGYGVADAKELTREQGLEVVRALMVGPEEVEDGD